MGFKPMTSVMPVECSTKACHQLLQLHSRTKLELILLIESVLELKLEQNKVLKVIEFALTV